MMRVVVSRRGVGVVLSAAMVGGAVVGGSVVTHREPVVASWTPAAVTIPWADIDQTWGPLTVVRMLKSVLDNTSDSFSAELDGHSETRWAGWWESSEELKSWLRTQLEPDQVHTALNLTSATGQSRVEGSLADLLRVAARVAASLELLSGNFDGSAEEIDARLGGGVARVSAAAEGSLLDLTRSQMRWDAASTLLSSEFDSSAERTEAQLSAGVARVSTAAAGSVADLAQGASRGDLALQLLLARWDSSAAGIAAAVEAGMARISTAAEGSVPGLGTASARWDGVLNPLAANVELTSTRVKAGLALTSTRFAGAASVASWDGSSKVEVGSGLRAAASGQVCAGSSCPDGVFVDTGFELSPNADATLEIRSGDPVHIKFSAPNRLRFQWADSGLSLTGELGATVQVNSVTVGRIIPVDIHVPGPPPGEILPAARSIAAPASATASEPVERLSAGRVTGADLSQAHRDLPRTGQRPIVRRTQQGAASAGSATFAAADDDFRGRLRPATQRHRPGADSKSGRTTSEAR